MVAEFQVRLATGDDLASVAALDRATELLPHWPESEYAAALTRTGPSSLDTQVRRCFFVAEARGEIAGFAVAMTAVAGAEVLAELESIAVAESTRRRGAASALCGAVMEWARSRAAKAIELEVRSRNAGAIRLYESLGFVAVGRRTNYYRNPADDAVWMRLALSSGPPE